MTSSDWIWNWWIILEESQIHPISIKNFAAAFQLVLFWNTAMNIYKKDFIRINTMLLWCDFTKHLQKLTKNKTFRTSRNSNRNLIKETELLLLQYPQKIDEEVGDQNVWSLRMRVWRPMRLKRGKSSTRRRKKVFKNFTRNRRGILMQNKR